MPCVVCPEFIKLKTGEGDVATFAEMVTPGAACQVPPSRSWEQICVWL